MSKTCSKHGLLEEKDIQNHPTGLRCRICHRANANRKRNGNREEFNAKQALDKQLNPEKWVNEYKRQNRKRREHDGELFSLRKVCYARRITPEDYFKMLEAQENKCGICGLEETCKDPRHDRVRRLSIDHCHRTGNVRGLLCHSCNTAIGKFKDDIELLHKAIRYITKHH